MKAWVGVILSALVLCSDAKTLRPNKSPANKYDPALAMYCGKVTQHRDVTDGKWVTDQTGETDCISDKDQILAYCKKVYPSMNITNIIEDTQKVHVPSWCALHSPPPCKGHGHNVKPFKCIVGQYETEALEVPDDCNFQHTHDLDVCQTSKYWDDKAGNICNAKKMTVSRPQMLQQCEGTDLWKGVQFLCCSIPVLPKPKSSKGKPKVIPGARIDVIEKPDVNPICLQPKLIGLCRALLPAWHFNKDSQKCELFYYGGCGGNSNNFFSEDECETSCFKSKSVTPPKPSPKQENAFCGLPSETGMCRAYFPRFYYDPDMGECVSFVYGGCGGNDNNFVMREDCEGKCKGFKKQEDKSTVVSPLLPLLPIDVGPVILDGNMKPATKEKISTTSAPEITTVDIQYTADTDMDTEHDMFVDKLEDLKLEHQNKVTKILGKWDGDNARLTSAGQSDELETLEMDLQMTISTLEDEYDAKMNKLNEFHMTRMDNMLAEKRSRTLQRFLTQLKAENPKIRHVLTALEKYIDVEKRAKTHTLQHYYMATHDDFNEQNIPDLKNRLSEIEGRINSTKTILNNYPDVLSLIEDEVEELLNGMPPTPPNLNEDKEINDGLNQEIIDFMEKNPEVSITPKPIMIDDGGLSEEDEFSDIDANGVLDSEDIDDDEDEDYPEDSFDLNKIESTFSENQLDDDEEEIEDESNLDKAVDDMFEYNGDPKFDVILNKPQPLYLSENDDEAVEVNYASTSSSWLMWLGVGTGTVFIIAVILALAGKRHMASRPPSRVVVDKEEDVEKEMTPEEKQLIQLQQNGYENPTYKFFEKQMA